MFYGLAVERIGRFAIRSCVYMYTHMYVLYVPRAPMHASAFRRGWRTMNQSPDVSIASIKGDGIYLRDSANHTNHTNVPIALLLQF